MTDTTALPLPLAGIRVLDFTTFLSGPSATQLLGDLGAEIIKIEPPAGDSSRTIPPHFIAGDSAYYLANNRNKRSAVIDLKHPEGRELVLDLIAQSDVVIENFRPGVMQRLGLDPADLLRDHTRLVWASISGFGQHGAKRTRPAYDMVVQALSGVMSVTGHPGQPAARLGIPAGDVIAGLYAVIGILSALVSRGATGRGRLVDVAMLDAQVAQLSYLAVYALIAGASPGPQGASHESIPTYRSFRGGDGREFVITANTQAFWERLARAIGVDWMLADPRFADEASRLVHRDVLWEVLEDTFSTDSASAWVDRLVEAGVPAAAVLDVLEAIGQLERDNRDIRVSMRGVDGAEFAGIATPIRFSDTPQPPSVYPPTLGQDTEDVLVGVLGLDGARIRRLRDEGVVAGATPAPHNERTADVGARTRGLVSPRKVSNSVAEA